MIRKIPNVGFVLPPTYSVTCVRCGENLGSFEKPDRLDDFLDHVRAVLVADNLDIEACKVACADCADLCRCPNCNRILQRDLCEWCPAPQGVDEFIAAHPGASPGMSVYACAVVFDIGNDELVALGETSTHVWDRIAQHHYTVYGVIYAGDDRNQAIARASEWNGMFHKQ
jgi:hypothetical protein